ncbi:sulfurtransferase-like selenium metabolism protein YedF [Maridesulfovibrio hydrothermalis]|uniref:SirA family protein n=1 Tax=Maridesulfovibrio hydrothermalis AM13 = DSM 14728 TaxID=1121451 RepID=L0REL6_9BACT|nr:sulfurtransferase-like selenium metabolism protein YedF [Maridesulfovibrio hydrothermalis]CCO24635.1 SirA family protein [Maridesulfovibrio hydrothermalis AM13 = DSM 14728]
MSVKLDCQGLPCPQPVIKCKNAIESNNPSKIKVIVDNEAAKENVSRFMTTKGYEVTVKEKGSLFTVKGKKSGEEVQECEECAIMSDEELAKVSSKTLVFLNSEFLGNGDDELGAKLMFNFIATLSELEGSLWRIIMLNSAVKLATEGNPCLEKLKELEAAGVSILVCGTCLEHFNILDKKEAGETTNMLDVVTSLQLATKVIKA